MPYTQRTIILPRKVADPATRRAFEIHVRLQRVGMARAAAKLNKHPEPRGGIAWFVPAGKHLERAEIPRKLAANLWKRAENRQITSARISVQLQAAAVARAQFLDDLQNSAA